MTEFTIASFNVKNLIGPDQEYYRFQSYTPEEYAWKEDWMADQLLSLDADIVGFQEVFEEAPLAAILKEVNTRAKDLNADTIPDRSKRYHRKVIFRKLALAGYADAGLFVAPNSADDGTPGNRRPGLAMLSRFGFEGTPEVIQDLNPPLKIDFGARAPSSRRASPSMITWSPCSTAISNPSLGNMFALKVRSLPQKRI